MVGFLLYNINSIVDGVKSDMFVYDDDTKISQTIVELHDCMSLKEDIDKIAKWSQK